jgi:superfamily II DNA or RNA helicase/ribosomal protein S27AE
MGAIDKATSYRIKDSEHIDNRQYQCPECGWTKLVMKAEGPYCKRCGTLCTLGFWDYRIRLMNKTRRGDYYFPIGLLSNVTEILKAYGYTIELLGMPRKPQKTLELTWTGPDLRNYQDEAVAKAKAMLERGEGCILELATGAGKSMSALNIIKEMGTPTLIVVHTSELMDQWFEVINKIFEIKASRYGNKKKEIGDITIAMVQSLVRAKTFPLDQFKMLVMDEVHHCPADTFYKIAMKTNAFYRIGLTATPRREDGNELKFFAAIGPIIKVITIKELIEQGYLAKPKFKFLQAPPGGTGKNYAEAYKNQIVMNDARNELIAKEAKRLIAEGHSVYIHVTQIAHGKQIAQKIEGSKFIYGTALKGESQSALNKLRIKELEDFKRGKLMGLVSTLLGEGVDIPNLDAIIMAAGGKSEVAMIQRVGRGLRPKKGTNEAIIVDILDQGKWLRDHAQARIMCYNEVFGE